MNQISNAICFATKSFDGKSRKGENYPAIFHSLEVAAIVQGICDDEEVVCAAVLHDTVEDTAVTLDEIHQQFGSRVAFLVASETENKYPDRNPCETWLIRKTATLEVLRNSSDPGIQALWLGDKLSNLRSFLRLKERMGAGMWQYFHQKDPKEHEKYYLAIAAAITSYADTQAYAEYTKLIKRVFEES